MWLLSNKISVIDSGLLEGFCDYHCHLLPGVDDGVKEMDETLHVLQMWETIGMKEAWLTPHIMEDIPNETNSLKNDFEKVKAQYTGALRLYLAAENMMDNLFLQRLEQHDLLLMGKGRRHLLVETSYYNPPMDMQKTIESIKENSYIPVLAHPERYQYMDMRHYKEWKDKGVLMQLNVPSLVGAYGPEVQWKAERLLDKGMYDYCGTDTHSMRFVEYFLSSKISKKTVKKVQQIVDKNTLYSIEI